ncbi:MAG: aldolase/citrate lyase family protein [Chloroflexota bacterium]
MRKNKVRRALQQGRAIYGIMIQEMRSSAIAQLMATAGFDFVFFDMEHGAYNMETVADLIKVARLSDITPLVRVPDDQYHLIARVLDAGAQGIMVPRIETRAQVEEIVQCAKFPPQGQRGCSVLKGHSDYQPEPVLEFCRQANSDNLVILQIERKQAIEDIESILSVKGVDGAIMGPIDLALSYGLPPDMSNPVIAESIQKVVDTCRQLGIASGMHTGNLDVLKEWMARGMQIIMYSTDLGLLLDGAKRGLQELREVHQAQ